MTQVAQQPYPATVPGQPSMIILSTAQGTPVQVVNGTYQHYNTKAARILGILQIILGILIIILEVVLTVISQDYIGFFGFLTSISSNLAGIIGVLSAKSKSRCKVIATMVFSIISAVLCPIFVAQGFAVGLSQPDAAIAFHVISAVLGLIGGIVAIVTAAYCCHGCCCKPRLVFTTQGLIPFNYVVQYQHNSAESYPVAHTAGGGAPYDSNPGPPAYQALQYEHKPDGSYPVAHTTGGGAPYDSIPDQPYQVLQHEHNPAESYLVAHTTGGCAPYDSNHCSPTYEVLQYEHNPAESYIVAHTEGGGAPYDSNPGSPASHCGSTPSEYTEIF